MDNIIIKATSTLYHIHTHAYSLAVMRRIKATPVSLVSFLSWPTCHRNRENYFTNLLNLNCTKLKEKLDIQSIKTQYD